MKQIKFGKTGMQVPAVAVGCMRMNEKTVSEMNSFIHTAVDNGAVFFDHADIYGGGQSEEVFGEAFSTDASLKREDVIIQSKCGIRKGYYDSSKEYLIESVEGILRRLKTDYLDVFLIHRPDALAEPEEIAEAFDALEKSGKVRHFGVSNHNPYQMRLLGKYISQDICTEQMQFSVAHAGMVAKGMEVNMTTEGSVDHDGGLLDFCRLNDITVQTWSPFRNSDWQGGSFIGNPGYKELNSKLDELGEKYSVSSSVIAAAWILRHPAGMQIISGTTREDRLKDIISACDVSLSREEWYGLYLSAGHPLP